MKIVVISGGFDPIHSGHIAYLNAAKELGQKLIVALNSDRWLINKKGSFFMPFTERKAIVENLSAVDQVIDFEDDSVGSASNALIKIKKMFPLDTIIFANGGDRDENNIPEMSIKEIQFVFGVGGSDKKNSSSWILQKWKRYAEDRVWGSFTNLFQENQVKVKELIINGNSGTSFQRHLKRNEIWLVSKGSCEVYYSDNSPKNKKGKKLNTHDYYIVPIGKWHQITNPFKKPCHVIEIQYGEACIEEDIQRVEYFSLKT